MSFWKTDDTYRSAGAIPAKYSSRSLIRHTDEKAFGYGSLAAGSPVNRSHCPVTTSDPLTTTFSPGAAANVIGLPGWPETRMWTVSR